MAFIGFEILAYVYNDEAMICSDFFDDLIHVEALKCKLVHNDLVADYAIRFCYAFVKVSVCIFYLRV